MVVDLVEFEYLRHSTTVFNVRKGPSIIGVRPPDVPSKDGNFALFPSELGREEVERADDGETLATGRRGRRIGLSGSPKLGVRRERNSPAEGGGKDSLRSSEDWRVIFFLRGGGPQGETMTHVLKLMVFRVLSEGGGLK